MPAQRELDDATVEAVLRGGPVPADLEPLTTALGALRALPERPVRPSAELSARMATGNFASAVAPRPSRRSAGHHAAARRRLAALPLWARVAAGSALALGGVVTASAAGALPEPAQQGVRSVIEVVTPFEFRDANDFGEEVSDDAKDGGVDGQEISEKAKEQGNQPVDPGRDQRGPAVVPPKPGDNPAGDRRATPDRPTNAPDDTPRRPAEPGRTNGADTPDDPGQSGEQRRPDDSGQSKSADPPNDLPIEPDPTD